MTREQEQWVRKAPILVAWTLILGIGGFTATTLKEISREIADLNSKISVIAMENKLAKINIDRLETWKDAMSTRMTRVEERCKIN